MPGSYFEQYYDITEDIRTYSALCRSSDTIAAELFETNNVYRGLRDLNGNGVRTGLTEISSIRSTRMENGVNVPADGELRYRGYDVRALVKGFLSEGRFGFEETAFLLLLGRLPCNDELEEFKSVLTRYRSLPTNFVRDIIMKATSDDVMNALSRCVLALHSYDPNPNDTSLENVMRQCLQLIALMPSLAVYCMQAYNFYHLNDSLIIHNPPEGLSSAESILYMLRPDSRFTTLEARTLDLALVLHAEHGGGNNSTFTMRVVTSSGTDTYASVSAALSSLKGPKHGGANIKVMQMFDDLKRHVRGADDSEALDAYLGAVLEKKAFDNSGLIYGMGHAVYSLSDPRAVIFKDYVRMLCEEKGLREEYRLYEATEKAARRLIGEKRRIYKGVSANIDFYSGLVYSLLGLPAELFTPIFAIARIVGWSAHRMEELVNSGKIIRPAYMSVASDRDYLPIAEREAQ